MSRKISRKKNDLKIGVAFNTLYVSFSELCLEPADQPQVLRKMF